MADTMDSPAGPRLKRVAAAILPGRVFAWALALRRRLYWWWYGRPRPRRARRAAERLLARGGPIRLELGSGPRVGMEGWISVDLNVSADIQHDLTKPLPLPDESVDAIYSSHMLEHFTYPRPMLDLLHDCRRVLKPGAALKVAVPNARIFLDAYRDPAPFDCEKFCTEEVGLHFTSRIDVVNFIAYLGGEHKFMFDEENLPRVLEEAGFRDAHTRGFDPSIDVARRRHESLYAEAVK
jgi:predicted SAM-dependent methyltransferase